MQRECNCTAHLLLMDATVGSQPCSILPWKGGALSSLAISSLTALTTPLIILRPLEISRRRSFHAVEVASSIPWDKFWLALISLRSVFLPPSLILLTLL